MNAITAPEVTRETLSSSSHSFRPLTSAAALALSLLLLRAEAPPTNPATLTADQIMEKAVEHSKWESGQFETHKVTYTKTSTTEQLDHTGQLKNRTEETYTVEFQADKVRTQLLEQSNAPEDSSSRREEKPLYLTAAIIAKFDFVLIERQILNGRDTYLLAFAPRENLSENGLVDRFLNHLAGWVWIDARDFAVAQARIRLTHPIGLWGGMLGSIKNFDYTVERTPIRDGLWFNRTSRGAFDLRKLFVSRSHKTHSEWKDIRIHAESTHHHR